MVAPDRAISLGSRLGFIFASLLYKSALDITYYFYLSRFFRYHNLTAFDLHLDAGRFFLSYLLVFAMSAVVPRKENNFNGMFYAIVLIFLYVPLATMYGMDARSDVFPLALTAFAIVVTMLTAISFERVWRKFPLLERGRSIALLFSTLMVAYFILWSIISGAVTHINFDFRDIYIYREILGEKLDVGFLSYLNIWTQKAFNPLLIAYAMYKRNGILLAISLLVQMYFFAVTQHRAHLFVPILIYMAYIIYQRRLSTGKLLGAAAAGVVLITTIGLYFEMDEALAVVIRRALFVAPTVAYEWVAYFSEREKVHFADNILRGWINNEYTGKNLPLFMGDYMQFGSDLAFNSGLIGAGFAQLGIWGVIIYASLLGIVLSFLNALITKGLPVFMVAALLIAPIRTAWADSDLFTALLSHGIIVCVVLLWLFGPDRRQERINEMG